MITLSEFRHRAESVDGLRLKTTDRERAFLLRVAEWGLEYTPERSGRPRPDQWARIGRVLQRFDETRSLRPKSYQDITHHSSYVLATLRYLFPELDGLTGAPKAPSSSEQLAEDNWTDVEIGKPHQRVGAISNAHVGADFEQVAQEYFRQEGITLTRGFPVEVGLTAKKLRMFDLGSADEKILVECNSHRWTAGGRVPSAKLTVWNEAMYYFHLAPAGYRKILFVLHDRREQEGESLLAYYQRTYAHLIPAGVEFLEWDGLTGDTVRT